MKKSILLSLFYLAIMPIKSLVLLLSPLLVVLLDKPNKKEVVTFTWFIILIFLGFFVSGKWYFYNLSASLLLLFPVLIFILFPITIVKVISGFKIHKILSFFTMLLLINGIIGLLQYIITPDDDSAIGFYGRSGLQTHGLAILYFMAAIYNFSTPDSQFKTLKSFLLLLFFVSCFYGTGLVSAILSVTVVVLLMAKSKFKFGLLVFLGAVGFIFIGMLISPQTMSYNYNILLLFIDGIGQIILGENHTSFMLPRKLIAWLNYISAAKDSVLHVFTGFGGGTFNSRAAFFLNGEYSSLSILPVSISNYHQVYIMPLWSNDILQQLYQEGTMNQPFSSVLSIISEYGIIIFCLFIYGFLNFRKILIALAYGKRKEVFLSMDILFVFFAILCLFENMLEYAEIVIPFFVYAYGIASSESSSL